jgi:hypothetical protein
MARFNERGRNIMKLRALSKASDIEAAHHLIAEALPPLLASALSPGQLEFMRQKLIQLPDPGPPRLTSRDAVGAMGIFLLCSCRRSRSSFRSFLSVTQGSRYESPIVVACAMLLVADMRLAITPGFDPGLWDLRWSVSAAC